MSHSGTGRPPGHARLQKASSLDVEELLSGKAVFLTGATGFVGIGLLEKILFSVPKVKHVYLLIRPRKADERRKRPARGPTERLTEELLTNSRFDRVRKAQQDSFDSFVQSKLTAIGGTLAKDRMGIAPKDYDMLVNKLKGGVFIHCAATVKFTEPLNTAIQLNVHGSAMCVELAAEARGAAFVQVSTNYVNCRESTSSRIMEVMYPHGFDALQVYADWRSQPNGLTEDQVDHLLNGKLQNQNPWPNTYTLSKSIGERVVDSMCRRERLPLSIVRLGIVCPDAHEVPGWYFGNGGFAIIILGIAYKIITIMHGDGTGCPDATPVDHTINATISAAADLLATPSKESSIYHIGIIDYQLDNWCFKDIIEVFWEYHYANLKKHPLPSEVEGATVRWIASDWRFRVEYFLRYHLPYYLLYPFRFCSRRISKNVHLLDKCRRKVFQMHDIYDYFWNARWIFDTSHTRALYDRLSPESQRLFDFDGRTFDLNQYCIDSATHAIREKQIELDQKRGKPAAGESSMCGWVLRNCYWLMGFAIFLMAVGWPLANIVGVEFGVVT